MEQDFKCPREGDLDELKDDMKDIKENHLPHLKRQMLKLDIKVWVIMVFLAAILFVIGMTR